MKKIMLVIPALLLALGLILTTGHAAWADEYLPGPSDMVEESGATLFSADELDDLLAPIALYPDPLIAQILPAATFIDQIDEAARYIRQYGKSARIDDQPWDVSVRALAHYPDVLFMMDQKYDWTVSLGQAYVNQPQDVMDAIQRLRAEAQDQGNLVSTPQQEVVVEDEDISIIPAEPEVIYVPQYDPIAVYVEPAPTYGFITFGFGFTIGPWLNRDCDWHRHRVYYHGWHGGGWINRARPYISTRRSVYINSRYNVINVNRRVIDHDTARYRDDLRHNVENRRERIGHPQRPGTNRPPNGGQRRGTPPPTAAPPATTPRPGTPPRVAPPAAGLPRPTTPTTAAPQPAQRPGNRDLYRGRETRGGQAAPYSGFGGYGSGKDATKFRERGQSSRENMRQFNRQQLPATAPRPAPAPRQAPAQHQTIPGGRPSASPPAVRPAAPRAPAGGPSGGGTRQQR